MPLVPLGSGLDASDCRAVCSRIDGGPRGVLELVPHLQNRALQPRIHEGRFILFIVYWSNVCHARLKYCKKLNIFDFGYDFFFILWKPIKVTFLCRKKKILSTMSKQ